MPRPLRPAYDRWREVDGTPIPLLRRVEQFAVSKEHGGLPSRLHQQGQVSGRGHNWLYVWFDGDNQLSGLRPHLVRVLDAAPGGRDVDRYRSRAWTRHCNSRRRRFHVPSRSAPSDSVIMINCGYPPAARQHDRVTSSATVEPGQDRQGHHDTAMKMRLGLPPGPTRRCDCGCA